MATAAPSPPRHDVGRSGSADESPETYYVKGEFKENVGRKPLANIPMPPSGVIHEAPRSPVRIEVPREDWHQSQSASIVEGSEYSRQVSGETRTSEQNENPGSQTSNKQELPFRQKHQGESTDMLKEQEAFKSSRSDGNSGLPLDEYPTNQGHVRHSLEGVEENEDSFVNELVPQLQYHHHSHNSEGAIRPRGGQSYLPNDPSEAGPSIDRFLTPKSQFARRTPIQRPHSTYSDFGARERSPAQPGYIPNSPSWGARAPSANSGRSNDRPLSYVDLLNVPYPQPPPVPISFGNAQLRLVVGSNASLLSTQKTLDMYRQNVKKTSDSETQYAFAIFLIQAAQEAGLNHEGSVSTHKASPKPGRDLNSPYIESAPSSPQELLREARNILQKLSDRSYPFAQYYLADGYASGLFSKGKEDYGTAFPLFVSASKHGHAESGYRAALCYEFGWGCRKDPAKAVQFYRQAASKNHPGAMTRLGRACLSGDLGTKQYREGLKWLKRATESADQQYNAAPYHLGQLYETGYGDDLFQDESYAAQLFTQAADLGHAEANYRLGDAYEHGKLACPRDPALSVHFYTGAAQRGHPVAMMALCAWYMVGAEPVLEKDENEAYEWARQAAECGLTKAEYAVGYFTEMGIGCRRDILEANVWYVKAADSGDERAKHRLAAIRAAAAGGTPMEVIEPKSAKMKKAAKKAAEPGNREKENEKDCIIM